MSCVSVATSVWKRCIHLSIICAPKFAHAYMHNLTFTNGRYTTSGGRKRNVTHGIKDVTNVRPGLGSADKQCVTNTVPDLFRSEGMGWHAISHQHHFIASLVFANLLPREAKCGVCAQVRRLLASNEPSALRVAAAPEAGDPEQMQAQQIRLMALGMRTMALPCGRAALTLGMSKDKGCVRCRTLPPKNPNTS